MAPNPTSDMVTLSLMFDAQKEEQVEFQILDLTGKVLDQFRANGRTNPYKFDNLDNGIYLVQLLVEGQIV